MLQSVAIGDSAAVRPQRKMRVQTARRMAKRTRRRLQLRYLPCLERTGARWFQGMLTEVCGTVSVARVDVEFDAQTEHSG